MNMIPIFNMWREAVLTVPMTNRKSSYNVSMRTLLYYRDHQELASL